MRPEQAVRDDGWLHELLFPGREVFDEHDHPDLYGGLDGLIDLLPPHCNPSVPIRTKLADPRNRVLDVPATPTHPIYCQSAIYYYYYWYYW